MADLSVRRVAALAALTGALVGGGVAGAVAVASTTSNSHNRAGEPGGGGSLTTAKVVRTTLTNAVQVGGSITYDDSYTIVAPSGASPQQVSQAEQAVTEDQETLSADERTAADAASAASQAIAADQANIKADRSTLDTDLGEKKDCAAPSLPACVQDTEKVSQDEAQLSQADQQLAAAESSATLDRDQNQAKIASDETKLQGDRTTLDALQPTALNPGTTYTYLPQAGDIIKEDHPVYSLNDEPVPLLYGSVPAYRAFYSGMSDGADIGELTHDLIALGYGTGLTENNHYSSATATAVRRWQAALGLPATGEILLGEAVFEPGPIRVTAVSASVGSPVGGGGETGGGEIGAVLTASSTTPVVAVDLDVSEEYLVKPGDTVSIVLPNGTSTVGGRIETVGNVATCPGGGGIGLAGGNAGSTSESPCASGGSNSAPTVPVTITLDRTPSGPTFDQAPVNVDITTERARDVLAVPVNSLLALAGGGFGVDVVTRDTTRLVGVTTGLYSNTLVQVSGSGIRPGTRVEVPSS